MCSSRARTWSFPGRVSSRLPTCAPWTPPGSRSCSPGDDALRPRAKSSRSSTCPRASRRSPSSTASRISCKPVNSLLRWRPRPMMPAVEIVNIARRFGDVQALAGVDLTVEAGEFFGLLGPNGAGKTTLISILAGLTHADAGVARVLGHDVVEDYRNARRLLGVVPQELVFDP